MDLHAYSFAYYGKSIFLSSIFCLFLKFRFVNSVRNRNETYVSRENLVFPFKSIYYYSLNRNFDSSSLKDIYIYIRICITIGKSGRRSKTRFPRWGKYFSTLGDTYLSSWEADARTDAYPNLHLQRDGEEIATRRFAV